MGLRIATYMGAPAIAGLGWERSPDRLSERTMGLRWGKTFARLNEPEHLGKPSLLSVLFGALPEGAQNQTILIAYAHAQSETYFGALVANGEPVIEAERLFEERTSLLNWIANECAQDGLDALALSDELKGAAKVDIPVIEISAPPEDYTPIIATGSTRRLNLSAFGTMNAKRKLNLALMLGVLLGCGGYFGYPAITKYRSKNDAPTAQAMITVFERRDEGAFLAGCAQAFERTWAIGPGWQRDIAGCTGPGMRAVGALPASTQPLAFQVYRLRAGWDVSVARKAARLVLEASSESISGTADTLIVTRPIAAPQVQSANAPQNVPDAGMQAALEAAFLGKARSVRALGPDFEITLWGGIADMTAPLAALDWLEVASIERRDGLISALVRARRSTPREIPDPNAPPAR